MRPGAQRKRPRHRRRRAATSVRSVQLRDQPAAGLEDAAVALEVPGRAGRRSASACCSAARSTCRSSAPTFFLKQGEIRYARTLELPASRGRIIDRNGLILAVSVPAPSLWAIPKDFDADTAQRAQLARLLGMTPAELDERLDDNPNFVWLRAPGRRAGRARTCWRSASRASTRSREYKRKLPRGRGGGARGRLHRTSRTSGQEGIELAFQKRAAGPRRRAPRHQGPARPRRRGHRRQRRAGRRPRHRARRSTRRCSSSPTSASATRSPSTRPRPAAWWCSTRRPARCWRWPTTRATTPADRRNLTRRAAAQPRADRHLRARLDDEAVHRRAGRWRRGRVTPEHRDPDRARPDRPSTGSTITRRASARRR